MMCTLGRVRVVARLLAVLVSLVPLTTRAEAPQILSEEQRSAQARQLYERGMASFQLEEWDTAIEAWEQAFRIKPLPQILYNIAQAHRLAKRYEKALSFYKKYLNMEPKAANRGEVDRHVVTLTKLIDEQRRASSAPPTAPIRPVPEAKPVVATVESSRPSPSPVGATKGEPKPVVAPVEPKPAVVTTAPPPVVVVESKPVDNRPITKKGWFWGVVGGAAAVVVAGVVIGVVVGTSDNTRNLPAVTF